VFDTLYLRGANSEKFSRNAFKRLCVLTNRKMKRLDKETPELDTKLDVALTKVSFYVNIENYARYFDRLHASDEDVTVVGDITPSYNMLEAADLTKIRTLLEGYGFTVKVVFLMRDPIERAFSAVRMQQRDMDVAGKAQFETANQRFNRVLERPGLVGRGRYDMTIEAVEAAFDADAIHYGFFETLFSNKEVRKITDFLGVDFVDPDFDLKANASPRDTELDTYSINKAREIFHDTYAFCQEKFGKDFIDEIWPHSVYLSHA
jgi:hypothetical protein